MTRASPLEERALLVVDASLYACFVAVTGAAAVLRAAVRACARHALVVLACCALLVYEARHWRACAPTVAAQLEGAAVVAASRQCDPRTEQHALFARCGLDCAVPREALAKGHALAMLECVAARQPLAAYAGLLAPLLHPERARTLEWMQGAALALGALVLVGWLVPAVLAWRREERLHGDVRTLVHAVNRFGARRALPAPAPPVRPRVERVERVERAGRHERARISEIY
jgi:hypothetical protein